MKKDTTLFRERFNRWKAGEKVYEAGLPVYRDGKSSQFVDYLKDNPDWGTTWQDRMPKVAINKPTIILDPTPDQINEHAIAVENPTRKGYNFDGTWSQYDDPVGDGLKNVAAGLLVNNEAARKAGKVGVVPDKLFYTNEEVSKPWLENYRIGWPNIAKEYDKKYGTSAYPHPSDTINLKTRLLATSTRGKSGNLNPEDWPNFYQAMADGDIAKQLVESRTKFGKNKDRFDNDRIRREAEALWPGRFNVTWDEKNPKKKAIVTPKFQGGKESEIYGGTLPEILVTPKGVGHNYEVTDNREMIPTGAQYSDAERHEMEGKLGGDYVRKNLHKAAPVVFDLLNSVELIANPMATTSAVKDLYNIVRHPKTTMRNISSVILPITNITKRQKPDLQNPLNVFLKRNNITEKQLSDLILSQKEGIDEILMQDNTTSKYFDVSNLVYNNDRLHLLVRDHFKIDDTKHWMIGPNEVDEIITEMASGSDTGKKMYNEFLNSYVGNSTYDYKTKKIFLSSTPQDFYNPAGPLGFFPRKQRAAGHEAAHWLTDVLDNNNPELLKLVTDKFLEMRLKDSETKLQDVIKELFGIDISKSEDRFTYFFDNNFTEMLARGSQIKDYEGVLKNNKGLLTPKKLKHASENYVLDTGLNNNMTDFFRTIVDFNKAAKFLDRYSRVLIPATTTISATRAKNITAPKEITQQ